MHEIEPDTTTPPPAGRVIIGEPRHTNQIMPQGDKLNISESERVVIGWPGHTDQVVVQEDELNTANSEEAHPQGY